MAYASTGEFHHNPYCFHGLLTTRGDGRLPVNVSPATVCRSYVRRPQAVAAPQTCSATPIPARMSAAGPRTMEQPP